MEDELRAQVKAAKKTAAAAGPPNLEKEEVQLKKWMTELREREDAVLQKQVWTTCSNNLGGAGVQRKGIRMNGPGLQGGAKAMLPSRDATRGMDPLFFDDLRLEYPSISETILRSIINNSLRPISTMKLSTEFSEGRTDRTEGQRLESADIRYVQPVRTRCVCTSSMA